MPNSEIITSSSHTPARYHLTMYCFAFLLHRGAGTKVTKIVLSAVLVKLYFLLLVEIRQSSLSGESLFVTHRHIFMVMMGYIKPVTSSHCGPSLNEALLLCTF